MYVLYKCDAQLAILNYTTLKKELSTFFQVLNIFLQFKLIPARGSLGIAADVMLNLHSFSVISNNFWCILLINSVQE